MASPAAESFVTQALTFGTATVMGSIPRASNDTILVVVEHSGRYLRAVYKPISGEVPLYDFAAGTLGLREAAAYRLSCELGLDVVPPTIIRHNLPSGPGSLQAYVEDSGGEEAVTISAVDEIPNDHAPIFALRSQDDRDLVLSHNMDEHLRRLAFFDLLANNADRKAGHVITGSYLPGTGPEAGEIGLYGIDNGLTFHSEEKLRTVLWGFSGTPFSSDEVHRLEELASATNEWHDTLGDLLDSTEIESLLSRANQLLELDRWPDPPADRTIIPWPPI